MKVTTSILMAILFLIQGMNVNMNVCEQIEKISAFIAHYQDHKEYDGDSFYEYVVEDYFNDEGDKEGHHKGSDQDKIPSHTHHQCCHPVVFIAPSNLVVIKAIGFESSTKFDHFSFHFNSRFLESLFQPPRV
jgi:hypothetical protein